MKENSNTSMNTARKTLSLFAKAFLPKNLFSLAAAATLLHSTAFAAPPNDMLANAIPITGGLPVTVGGTNTAATTEAGEPRHTELPVADDQAAPHKSIWWTWTSTVTGPVSISTQNSGSFAAGDPLVDTQVGVYSGGPTMGTLTLVARKDDSDGRYAYGWTYLTFNATSGTTYYIAVDGWQGAHGRISLTLLEGGTTPPPPPPVETNRTLTINIVPAASGTVSASPEPGENGYANGTVVTLTATPAGDGTFSGWTGSASAATRTVTVVMNGNKTVNAVFNADTVLYGTLPDSRVVTWLYHGNRFAGGTVVRGGKKIPGWRIAGAGDFNGDSKKDIAIQNANGTLAVWFMNDAAYLSNAPLRAINKDWAARAVGDFNGDGSADIAFQHTNGRMNIWFFNGTTFSSSRLVRAGNIYPGWNLASAGDVNADSTDDLILKHNNGRLHAWRMTNGNFVAASVLLSGKQVPLNWHVVGLTDVNLDDSLDIVIQHARGRVTAWFMTNMLFSGSASMRNVDSPGTKMSATN